MKNAHNLCNMLLGGNQIRYAGSTQDCEKPSPFAKNAHSEDNPAKDTKLNRSGGNAGSPQLQSGPPLRHRPTRAGGRWPVRSLVGGPRYALRREHGLWRSRRRWCRSRAADLGARVREFMDLLLADRVDRLRGAQSLLRLAEKYGDKRLEAAYDRALNYNTV